MSYISPAVAKLEQRYINANPRTILQLVKFSKHDLQLSDLPMWKQLRAVGGDPLAFRQLVLRSNGYHTLVNVIRGSHGLSNKY